jgi:uncharacterized protein YprB with RNaseH-like and TPR domain
MSKPEKLSDYAKRVSQVKALIFDIETSDFNANVGHLLCCCSKWLGEKKVHTLRIDDFPGYKRNVVNDRKLVTAVRNRLAEADMVISWYGRNRCFDEPFLRTRIMKYGLDPLPPYLRWDGQREARQYFKFNGNRLDNVGRFLGIDWKTHFDGQIWMRAVAGHRPSMNRIVDHCVRDVDQLEAIYMRMSPHTPHPNMNVLAQLEGKVCPRCLSRNLKKDRYHSMQVGRVQRWRCKDCGYVSREGKHIGGKVELR